jgi:hypothetical protein
VTHSTKGKTNDTPIKYATIHVNHDKMTRAYKMQRVLVVNYKTKYYQCILRQNESHRSQQDTIVKRDIRGTREDILAVQRNREQLLLTLDEQHRASEYNGVFTVPK